MVTSTAIECVPTSAYNLAVVEIHNDLVVPRIDSNSPIGIGVSRITLVQIIVLTVDVVSARDSTERMWIRNEIPPFNQFVLEIGVRWINLPAAPRIVSPIPVHLRHLDVWGKRRPHERLKVGRTGPTACCENRCQHETKNYPDGVKPEAHDQLGDADPVDGQKPTWTSRASSTSTGPTTCTLSRDREN